MMRDKRGFINFLIKAKEFVWNSPPPWQSFKKGRRGRPAYNSRTMLLCCLLKERFSMTYRETESLINSNNELKEILELESVPGKSTIQLTMKRIKESYLRGMLNSIADNFKKRA